VAEEKSSTTLNLKVLTPDGPVLEGEVYEVTLPGSEGEMGILPQHAALLTNIIPGRLSYRAADGDDTAALGKGVAEVQNNEVRVLVDTALLKEEINASDLEGKRKDLLDQIDKETHEDKLARLEDELAFLDVQLRVHRGD
jgi:F-type H+-transporting ATPase subunit epsilon